MTRRRVIKLYLQPDGQLFPVTAEKVGDGYTVALTTQELDAHVTASDSGPWSVVLASGYSHEALVENQQDQILVTVEDERFLFHLQDDSRTGSPKRKSSTDGEVAAPMPGKVVKIQIAPGEEVEAGQPILLFEAMKMQNEIRSPQDGVLSKVFVTEGQAVDAREKLFVVSPQDNSTN